MGTQPVSNKALLEAWYCSLLGESNCPYRPGNALAEGLAGRTATWYQWTVGNIIGEAADNGDLYIPMRRLRASLWVRRYLGGFAPRA